MIAGIGDLYQSASGNLRRHHDIGSVNSRQCDRNSGFQRALQRNRGSKCPGDGAGVFHLIDEGLKSLALRPGHLGEQYKMYLADTEVILYLVQGHGGGSFEAVGDNPGLIEPS